jgi:hypothetical protein
MSGILGGGILGGINQTSKTLTSIVTISDGFTTMSGGNITGTQSISTNNLTINNNLNVPEITTGNIQTINNSLVIGDPNDSITIYGNDIRLIGNVIGYDSANVIISDKAIDLNAGMGNLFLNGAGINILGDGNLTVSSLTTDAEGEWSFSSPNGNLTVGTLKAGNVEIDNISFDNLSSANIEATQKFITPNVAILDRTVSRTSAISHLNTNTLKAQKISVGNITASYEILNKNNFDLSTIYTLNQIENGYIILGSLMIQWGTVPDGSTQNASFNPVFLSQPYNIQASRQQITSGGSTATGALRILGSSASGASFDSVTGSGDKTAIYWLAIGPI